MENAVQQGKPNRLRAGLLALLGVVALGAVVWTTVLPIMKIGRPDAKKFEHMMAMSVEQTSPDGSKPAGDGSPGQTMPDGSARIVSAPTGDRHDPFKPLFDGKKPDAPATSAKPSLGPPPTDSGSVPPLPAIGSPGGFETAPGLPLQPERAPQSQPAAPSDPLVMMGTAVGVDAIVLFKRGNEILERRVGDYLGPYRITEVTHGKIHLIDEQKNQPWMESGQFLLPGGAPTRFDPSAATHPGQPAPAPAPATADTPRSAAPVNGTYGAAPADNRLQPVRLSDNRWPSTVR
jgi:hypothetical protein